MRPIPAALLAGGFALAASPAVRAHASGVAYLDLAVEGRVLTGDLDLAAADVAEALSLDADGDGLLSRADVDRTGPAAARWLASSLRIVSAGAVCPGEPVDSVLRDDQLLTLRARWRCPADSDALSLFSRLEERMGKDHALYVHARRGDRSSDTLLAAGRTEATLSFGGPGGVAGRFILLGLEHIFTGLDHILFLVTLLLLGGSLRRLAGIVTAFTAAHSLTLSVAVLGLVRDLPTRWVESAIAASIVWVAAENLRYAAPSADGLEPAMVRWRWLPTFVFGLVHGFGFAGALRETGLPAGQVPLALGTFNLGVELGQLGIVLLAWPLLRRAARTEGWRPRGVRVASGAALVVAVWWFAERAFF